MKILLGLLIGVSLFASKGLTQDEKEETSPLPENDFYLADDVSLTTWAASRVEKIEKKPAPSDHELRNTFQYHHDFMMYRIFWDDDRELTGRSGWRGHLELTQSQTREWNRCSQSRSDQFNDITVASQRELQDAKNSQDSESICRSGGRRVAELTKDMLDDFRSHLLPHQIHELDVMISKVNLITAQSCCEVYDMSLYEVFWAYLDLSVEQERQFKVDTVAAIKQFEQRIAHAKKELRNDLLHAAPESKRDDLRKFIGDDSGWLITRLKTMMTK